MNKKVIIGIITIVVIIIVVLGGYFLLNNNDKTNENEKNPSRNPLNENNGINTKDDDSNEENPESDSNSNQTKGKILVVYFSATNNTKNVAEKIAQNLKGDLFEIVPDDAYTSNDLDWTNNNSRVSREHEDESLRNIKLKTTKVENWENYDTVIIGYPIWWGIAAWPVNTFIKSNNFNGKTVIPFCTSASSSLGESGKLLESIANGGKWLEGHRFNSNPSASNIKAFTDSIK